jgi:hypothetical protein
LKALFFAQGPTVNTQPLLIQFGGGTSIKSEGENTIFNQVGSWTFGQLVQGKYSAGLPLQIAQMACSIQNPGNADTVALLANAIGNHVFGADLICYAKGDEGDAKNEFDFGCLPVELALGTEQTLSGIPG